MIDYVRELIRHALHVAGRADRGCYEPSDFSALRETAIYAELQRCQSRSPAAPTDDSEQQSQSLRWQRLDHFEKVKMLDGFVSAEIDAARDALNAELRWKGARHAYAELYALMLAEYGEDKMPPWDGKIRGPKPVVKGGA